MLSNGAHLEFWAGIAHALGISPLLLNSTARGLGELLPLPLLSHPRGEVLGKPPLPLLLRPEVEILDELQQPPHMKAKWLVQNS